MLPFVLPLYSAARLEADFAFPRRPAHVFDPPFCSHMTILQTESGAVYEETQPPHDYSRFNSHPNIRMAPHL
jgi:hypothetical protein